jgi:glycosyltransferase involved in cell wall biosynthesis
VTIVAHTGSPLAVPELDRAPAQPARASRTAKRHVCMVAYTHYANDARVRREAETLAAGGFHVRCLTNRSGDAPRRFTLEGVEVHELDVPKYRGKSTAAYLRSYLRFLLTSSAACVRLLARGELDVVHVHNLPDFLVFAALVPRLAGKRVVLDIHDSVPETFATKFSGRHLLQRALCLEERVSALVAHRVICVNHPQRDTLVARGLRPSKTFVSMNVPDPRIFVQPGSVGVPPAPRETFDLVYHGTMAERLGVDLVIRAVGSLRERIPSLRLHLWGDGDDLAAFQSLARDLQLDRHILFNRKGYPLHELPDRLSRMSLGVIGNRQSVAGDLMLPVKLMEYVSLGIPVVAPRLKAIRYYFSDSMVTFYEPEDVESMAAAIFQLFCAPDRRLRQAATATTFLGEHGWQHQGAELVSFYQQLLET